MNVTSSKMWEEMGMRSNVYVNVTYLDTIGNNKYANVYVNVTSKMWEEMGMRANVYVNVTYLDTIGNNKNTQMFMWMLHLKCGKEWE